MEAWERGYMPLQSGSYVIEHFQERVWLSVGIATLIIVYMLVAVFTCTYSGVQLKG